MGRTSDAKERLMDAALSLMWEQGYGGVTIDDICRRAGVNKGSFYYFFESKSGLAVAALERHWQAWKPLWDGEFSPVVAPLKRIRNHCEDVYKQQVGSKNKKGRALGCPFCTLGTEICKQDEAIRAKVCEILGRKLKYWESAIRDAQREGLIGAGSAREKANCAVAYFEGLLAQARLHNDAVMLASLGNKVCAHIIGCSGKSRHAKRPTNKPAIAATARVARKAPPVFQEADALDLTRD